MKRLFAAMIIVAVLVVGVSAGTAASASAAPTGNARPVLTFGTWALTCYLGGGSHPSVSDGSLLCQGPDLTSSWVAPVASAICKAWEPTYVVSYDSGRTACSYKSAGNGGAGGS